MATGTTDITDILKHIGVEIVRVGEREIQGRCPVHVKHTGKADRSPSWSMNATTGAWICFSCGARGSLIGLVQELTGSDQLAYDFYSTLINNELEKFNTPIVTHKPEVDWVTYTRYPAVPDEQLSSRSLSSFACSSYGIRWDTTNECWVIPIMDKDHNLLGWQSKKTGWVRNHPVGVKKSSTLFGIDLFMRGGTAVLVESPLDVVRLASVDCPYQGLASFGTAISHTQISLLSEVAARVIVAMDNDDAGITSAKKLFETLPRFRHGILWLNYKHTNAKDIGEMTNDEILKAIDSATALPGWLL